VTFSGLRLLLLVLFTFNFEVMRLRVGLGHVVGDLEFSRSVTVFIGLYLFQAAFETTH
jgi:hypothetical protein